VAAASEPEGTFTISNFFIASAYASHGYGRRAFAALEGVASRPPFNAKCLTLMTVARESQMDHERYLALGRQMPKVVLQGWYESMGYVVTSREKGVFDAVDENGKLWHADAVTMKTTIR
jgi:hypothetical protein